MIILPKAELLIYKRRFISCKVTVAKAHTNTPDTKGLAFRMCNGVKQTLNKYNIQKSTDDFAYMDVKDAICNYRPLSKDNLEYIQNDCSPSKKYELIQLYNEAIIALTPLMLP